MYSIRARPVSPNPQRKQQTPMNPILNSLLSREPPQPPLQPNVQPNQMGGNPNLPTAMMPQYVIIRMNIYQVLPVDSFQYVNLKHISAQK